MFPYLYTETTFLDEHIKFKITNGNTREVHFNVSCDAFSPTPMFAPSGVFERQVKDNRIYVARVEEVDESGRAIQSPGVRWVIDGHRNVDYKSEVSWKTDIEPQTSAYSLRVKVTEEGTSDLSGYETSYCIVGQNRAVPSPPPTHHGPMSWINSAYAYRRLPASLNMWYVFYTVYGNPGACYTVSTMYYGVRHDKTGCVPTTIGSTVVGIFSDNIPTRVKSVTADLYANSSLVPPILGRTFTMRLNENGTGYVFKETIDLPPMPPPSPPSGFLSPPPYPGPPPPSPPVPPFAPGFSVLEVTFSNTEYEFCDRQLIIKFNYLHDAWVADHDTCSTENATRVAYQQSAGFEKWWSNPVERSYGKTAYFFASTLCESGFKFRVTCPATLAPNPPPSPQPPPPPHSPFPPGRPVINAYLNDNSTYQEYGGCGDRFEKVMLSVTIGQGHDLWLTTDPEQVCNTTYISFVTTKLYLTVQAEEYVHTSWIATTSAQPHYYFSSRNCEQGARFKIVCPPDTPSYPSIPPYPPFSPSSPGGRRLLQGFRGAESEILHCFGNGLVAPWKSATVGETTTIDSLPLASSEASVMVFTRVLYATGERSGFEMQLTTVFGEAPPPPPSPPPLTRGCWTQTIATFATDDQYARAFSPSVAFAKNKMVTTKIDIKYGELSGGGYSLDSRPMTLIVTYVKESGVWVEKSYIGDLSEDARYVKDSTEQRLGRVLKMNAEGTALVAAGNVLNTHYLYKWNEVDTRWDFVRLIAAPEDLLDDVYHFGNHEKDVSIGGDWPDVYVAFTISVYGATEYHKIILRELSSQGQETSLFDMTLTSLRTVDALDSSPSVSLSEDGKVFYAGMPLCNKPPFTVGCVEKYSRTDKTWTLETTYFGQFARNNKDLETIPMHIGFSVYSLNNGRTFATTGIVNKAQTGKEEFVVRIYHDESTVTSIKGDEGVTIDQKVSLSATGDRVVALASSSSGVQVKTFEVYENRTDQYRVVPFNFHAHENSRVFAAPESDELAVSTPYGVHFFLAEQCGEKTSAPPSYPSPPPLSPPSPVYEGIAAVNVTQRPQNYSVHLDVYSDTSHWFAVFFKRISLSEDSWIGTVVSHNITDGNITLEAFEPGTYRVDVYPLTSPCNLPDVFECINMCANYYICTYTKRNIWNKLVSREFVLTSMTAPRPPPPRSPPPPPT